MKVKGKITLTVLGIIVGIVLVASFSTIITVQPGERAIVFRPWTGGLDKENILTEGIHIIAPWNKTYTYDVREQI